MLKNIRSQLHTLENDSALRRIPERIDRGAELYLVQNGQRLLNLASNNYLGLADSHALVQAAADETIKHGTSSGASRLISGQYNTHTELEKQTAQLKRQESALVVGSGYAANLCILTALAGRKTAVFSDKLNHASIVDGCILSRCRQIRYRHLDVEHLSHQLKRYKDHAEKLVITDTVFSMDGDLAPLEDIVRLCREHDALLVVDEAHATGIFGRGRGLAAEMDLSSEVDVHMGTFSKALGSHGGYIAGSEDIIRFITTKGRAFIYSTALPPAVTGASLAAVEHVLAHPEEGKRLLQVSRHISDFLKEQGFDSGPGDSQIIPVIIGANHETLDAAGFLREKGLFLPAIRPPTVPENTARLRLSLRADMTGNELDMLKNAFWQLGKGRG